MADATIKEATLVPADPTQPAGAQVTVIAYQVASAAIRSVIIPSAAPTLAQVTSAIQADYAFEQQFVGKTVSTS